MASAAQSTDVHVYGTDWCKLTTGLRHYLTSAGVPFRYHNIEDDPRAEQAVLDMNGGERKFPLVVVSGRVLYNPGRWELEAALREEQGHGTKDRGQEKGTRAEH